MYAYEPRARERSRPFLRHLKLYRRVWRQKPKNLARFRIEHVMRKKRVNLQHFRQLPILN